MKEKRRGKTRHKGMKASRALALCPRGATNPLKATIKPSHRAMTMTRPVLQPLVLSLPLFVIVLLSIVGSFRRPVVVSPSCEGSWKASWKNSKDKDKHSIAKRIRAIIVISTPIERADRHDQLSAIYCISLPRLSNCLTFSRTTVNIVRPHKANH